MDSTNPDSNTDTFGEDPGIGNENIGDNICLPVSSDEQVQRFVGIVTGDGGIPSGDETDTDANTPFQINEWCAKCWPQTRSSRLAPDDKCISAGHTFTDDDKKIITIFWPPVPTPGQQQAHVVVRTPPANFDFSHMQYLPCGYGRDCKHGIKCTRAHSNPPQAEIAYWNFLQPLGPPSRRRRAANEKRATAKDWTSNIVYECHVCGVRMNSKAQLVQHQSGNKHRAQVAANAGLVNRTALGMGRLGKPSYGYIGAGASSDIEHGRPALPHGTGPYYASLGNEWASADDFDALAMSDSQIAYGRDGTERNNQYGLRSTRDRTASRTMRVAELNFPMPEGDSSQEEFNSGQIQGKRAQPGATGRGQYALMQSYLTAVKSGDTKLVAKMISDGVPIDARDAGCTALQWAIFMRRVETALFIISVGAQSDLVDADQQTAIHICLHPRHGMMKQSPDDVTAASRTQHEEDTLRVLTALLEAGWSPDKRDARGRTGLHHVAEHGNINLALVLLKYKANPKILNKEGWSATEVATLKAKTEGLTKFVQLRDLLLTASFESETTESPMSIPSEENQAHMGDGPRVVVDNASSSTAGTTKSGMRDLNSNLIMPSMAGTATANEKYDQHDQFSDVQSVFRPLMAALSSFSGTFDNSPYDGVEFSQLALRLQPVIDQIGPAGLQCTTYINSARDRGLVHIQQSANRRQYVVIAPKYAHLLGQPTTRASNPTFDKMDRLSTWSSPDFGSFGRPKVAPLNKATLDMANLMSSFSIEKEPDEPTLIEQDFTGHNKDRDLSYEEMARSFNTQEKEVEELPWTTPLDKDLAGQADKSQQHLLNQINESFNSDPFFNQHQGPEPLFPAKLPPITGQPSITGQPLDLKGDIWSSDPIQPGSSQQAAISKQNNGSVPASWPISNPRYSSPLSENSPPRNKEPGARPSEPPGLGSKDALFLSWQTPPQSQSNKGDVFNLSNEPDATLS